jgi:hypothetical protein
LRDVKELTIPAPPGWRAGVYETGKSRDLLPEVTEKNHWDDHLSDLTSRLRHSMRKAGKSFEWMVKNDESHEFSIEQDLFELYETVHSFRIESSDPNAIASSP